MLHRLLYFNFMSVYRLDRWMRRRFTASGSTLLMFAVAAAVFGINTRQTLSYQLFALLFSALLFSWLMGRRFRPRVRMQRRLPRFATVGQPLLYTLEVRNDGSSPERGLLVADYPGAPPPPVDAFFSFREPRDRLRNWFDRRVGYPRWMQFMRRRDGMTEVETELPELPAKRSLPVRLSVTPQRRGLLLQDRRQH